MTEKDFMITFSKILRKELSQRRLSIATFSDLAGISRITGTALVDGEKNDMKLSTVFKMCDALDIPIEALFLKNSSGYDGLRVNLKIGFDSYTAYLNKQ